MLQSFISRFAFFGGVALLLLSVPVFHLMNAEASPLKAENKGATSLQSDASVSDLGNPAAKEEPVVKLASLTEGATKPSLEILEPVGSVRFDTTSRIERASELVKEQKFDEALASLEGVQFSDRNSYPVKFLEARILAWSGQHVQAEQSFANLSLKYPEDLDVMVSYGYLKLYQRNFAASEKLFDEVLNLNPDYRDAQTGLERARRGQNKF